MLKKVMFTTDVLRKQGENYFCQIKSREREREREREGERERGLGSAEHGL